MQVLPDLFRGWTPVTTKRKPGRRSLQERQVNYPALSGVLVYNFQCFYSIPDYAKPPGVQ